MSTTNGSFALMTTQPILAAEISASSVAFTACEITSDIQYKPEHQIKIIRKDGAGRRKGSFRDDKEEVITFTIAVPEAGRNLVLGGVAVIAVASGYGTKFNGNWELDDLPETYKAGDKGEVQVTLRRSEYETLVG